MCGEARIEPILLTRCQGPSPRVRGSRLDLDRNQTFDGSIPACAGKPSSPACRSARRRVHPRVCGEAVVGFSDGTWVRGPSPRVRGSRRQCGQCPADAGSIPACAGKPGFGTRSAVMTRVHPRVCGEAISYLIARTIYMGPSPRVRGSPHAPSSAHRPSRSIPACAGKPPDSKRMRPWVRVHPRVCGEAFITPTPSLVPWGPSPRVRGSLRGRPCAGSRVRSIPACAGKPMTHDVILYIKGVHPRVCGEAGRSAFGGSADGGPSPRVRGSPKRFRDPADPLRSIPACAGKPTSSAPISSSSRVHPRVCGEAAHEDDMRQFLKGPSPRVRGSRRLTPAQPPSRGSIPACAGKPLWPYRLPIRRRVHPRVCGEARSIRAM